MKSKLQWLTLGDRNTKFIQLVALNKRRKNIISHLQKLDLSWINDPNDIEYEIPSYLKNIYTENPSQIDAPHYSFSTANFPSLNTLSSKP